MGNISIGLKEHPLIGDPENSLEFFLEKKRLGSSSEFDFGNNLIGGEKKYSKEEEFYKPIKFENNEKRKRLPPKKIEIAGIEALVVDPHHDVLPLWFTLQSPAVLVHVDQHADMGDGRMGYSRDNKESVEVYTRSCLDITSFITPAVHGGKVVAVYHVRPRPGEITAYGRVGQGKVTCPLGTNVDKFERVFWDKPLPKTDISGEELVADLSSGFPLILDIDLDGFHLFGYDDPEVPYAPRLAWTKSLLERLPRPAIITMASSQTPGCYVHPDILPRLKLDCIEMLEGIYSQGGKRN